VANGPSKSKLIIYGAGDIGGRFAVEWRDLGKNGEFDLAGFVDDAKTGQFLGFPILGNRAALPRLLERGFDHVMVTMYGNAVLRLEICEELERLGFSFPSFHQYIPPETRVGKGVTVHESADLIGFDTVLEDFCVVGHHVAVEGRARVGRGTILCPFTFIGYGADIGEAAQFYPHSSCLPMVKVGKGCVINTHVFLREDLPDGEKAR